jgi:hypothetical protein
MLGWIGNLFIVAGLWGVGNKRRGAFLFSIAGEGAWIANAYSRGDWALTFICVVFLLMAVRAYVLWGKA